MFAIETNALTKYYGKARGIVDVDLTVPQGDFFGFIGPNGAGKSTLIRTLLGFLSPSSGSAQIMGRDTAKDKVSALSQIGYLSSDCLFYPGMRVGDLLALSAKLRKSDCNAEAKRLCERLDLDASRKISDLSFGNRKKVGIVCALQHKPSICIFDEPTSGLDPLMQKEFFSILKERHKDGATIFLSSHILSEVEQHCSHAAVIREGRLLISDSVEKLSHSGVKRITLKGVLPFDSTAEMHDIVWDGNTVRFLYNGNQKVMMQLLASLSFEDIQIHDPTLDEIFLHYYQKEASV